MDASVTTTETNGKTWDGGNKPFKASYGKLMMWFFIVSDALTFSGFLASYGFSRFKFIDSWPIADEVFTHFPFLHGVEAPMYYVAFMTFILIMSSVTMVLAVDAGHHMKKNKVIVYMFLTIIGGAIFVGSQAWEWATFIKGEYGALETKGSQILQFVHTDGERAAISEFGKTLPSDRARNERKNGVWYESEKALPTKSVEEVKAGFIADNTLLIRLQDLVPDVEALKASGDPDKIARAEEAERRLVNPEAIGEKSILNRAESLKKIEDAVQVVEGANLIHNEYGTPLFANFFFFITGFHGFHVFSGVLFNLIIFFNIIIGTYERRGHYEMVEKVGLYWHFVDLVWVFVFTFFYLV